MGFWSRARGRSNPAIERDGGVDLAAKKKLVDEIVELNPSATPAWLGGFDEPALRRYLEHLDHAQQPRGRKSYWFRDAETHAVVTRRKAAA
jgi:hypothetical protein